MRKQLLRYLKSIKTYLKIRKYKHKLSPHNLTIEKVSNEHFYVTSKIMSSYRKRGLESECFSKEEAIQNPDFIYSFEQLSELCRILTIHRSKINN